MVSFFSENYYIYHYSNVCSNAFLFMVVLILFSILLPFFTNLGVLDKFWKPKKVFTDHPIVQYNDDFFIELIYYSNEGETSQLDKNKLSDDIAIINSINIQTEEYSNKDIINKIKFKININHGNQHIKEIKFYIFFDYYMTEDVNIHLRSKAHVFYLSDSPEPTEETQREGIIKFVSNGDLVLKQNKGLVETYFMETQGSSLNYEDEINTVKNDPFHRDDNYYFEYKKTDILVDKSTSTDNLDMEININIPYYQDIIVELPNYTNLKNRWILYSILFFPTVYVCYCLMEMVINNQIFKTRIRSDIPIKI